MTEVIQEGHYDQSSRAVLFVGTVANIFVRDLRVLRRDLLGFTLRVAIQPLFLLFVFGRVITGLGYASPVYAQVLYPGLMALITVMTAMQGVSTQLMIEFGYTREIEDRILSPIPIFLVALEKVLFSALTGMAAAVLMIPTGLLVLGRIPWVWSGVPILVIGVVLGGIVGASIGMILGSLAGADKIGMMLTLVFPVLFFTGASQYPWPQLASLRWFQVVTTLNPITYVSEALRGALVPNIPHINSAIALGILLVLAVVSTIVGCRAFVSRVVS